MGFWGVLNGHMIIQSEQGITETKSRKCGFQHWVISTEGKGKKRLLTFH